MADAAAWMTAAEPALGLDDGTLVTSFQRHQDKVSIDRLEDDPTARLLLGHLRRSGSFEGIRDGGLPVTVCDIAGAGFEQTSATLAYRFSESRSLG